MKHSKKLLLSIAFFSILFTFVYPNKADASESTNDEIGYHIYAIRSENQIDEEESYFDLRMDPSEEHTIEFVIANTSQSDQTFKIDLNQAYTNIQGFIDYSIARESEYIEDIYDMNTIASLPDEVEVPKQSVKKVPITLTMPPEEFAGEILAGIKVTKLENEADNEGISNSYSYILGLRLTENDDPLEREIELKAIEPAVSFGKTSIVIKLLNPVMEAYGNLKYDVKIMNQTDPDSTKEKTFDGLEMAPNSLYRFSVDWDGEEIVPGDYELELTIEDQKENKWTFRENFVIDSADAEEVNKVVIDQTPERFNQLTIALLIVVILLSILIIFMRRRRHTS